MENIEIIRSFKQGGTGNCVSIAIIKAGVEVFGVNQILNHSAKEDGSFDFVMRDGFAGTVNAVEFNQAMEGSKFIAMGNAEIFRYANICFAAMAKRAMIEGNDDIPDPTYEQAIGTLNDGEYYLHGANWLGLRHHIRSIGRRFALHNIGCVGASPKHCFYVSKGIEDKYGEPNPLNIFERTFASWFRIAPEPVY